MICKQKYPRTNTISKPTRSGCGYSAGQLAIHNCHLTCRWNYVFLTIDCAVTVRGIHYNIQTSALSHLSTWNLFSSTSSNRLHISPCNETKTSIWIFKTLVSTTFMQSNTKMKHAILRGKRSTGRKQS